MASFDGKVVIITGGALGIGQATAWEFAKEGAMVAVADVNREAGEATVAEVERLGGSGLMLEADVADSSDCRRVVELPWSGSAAWTSCSITSEFSRLPRIRTWRTRRRRCGTASSA